ncbi:MAG: hypothetical protein ABFD82_17270 [Syntrophaceae bacterium]
MTADAQNLYFEIPEIWKHSALLWELHPYLINPQFQVRMDKFPA